MELAEDYYKSFEDVRELRYSAFLAGRKSVGGEFHLTREEFHQLVDNARRVMVVDFCSERAGQPIFSYRELEEMFTPPIYPTIITVGYEDGKYFWETLNCFYN